MLTHFGSNSLQDFSATTRNLEEFVTEIGNVENMMRTRLLDLVRALEAQNREDKAARAETERRMSELSERHNELLAKCDRLEKQYMSVLNGYGIGQSVDQHIRHLCSEKENLVAENQRLLFEREILRRRLTTAVQYAQLPRAAGNSHSTGGQPASPSKSDLNQAVGGGTDGSIGVESDLGTKPKAASNTTAMISPSGNNNQFEVLKQIALGSRQFMRKNDTVKTGEDASLIYRCPIKQCDETFPFPKGSNPPLDGNGKISDKQKWDDDSFSEQIETLQQHMKKRHASVPTGRWPPGFAKRPRPNPPGQRPFYWYTCPFQNCDHKFAFEAKLKPPLDNGGQVSDARVWDAKRFGSNIEGIRNHLKAVHPNFPKEQWPTGIAGVESPGCHKYGCPVKGCSRIFDIPESFKPPLDSQGKVTDAQKWRFQALRPIMTTITRHMQSSHPEVPVAEWPPALAPESSGDTDTDSSDDDGDSVSRSSGEERMVADKEENEGDADEEEGEDVLVI